METFDNSAGNLEESIRCAHCDGINTHPASAYWLNELKPLRFKDSHWSVPCGILGCEGCPGLTAVHLMFSKGSTWVHTFALRTR